MRILSVRKETSGASKVAFSGGFSFSLGPEWDERIEALRKEGEFDESHPDFLSMRAGDEKWRAAAKAAELCARAEQCEAGLRAKLRERGFSAESAGEAVELLKMRGILDDSRYCEMWADSRARRRPCGPAVLAAELRAKGVGGQAVSSGLSRVDFAGVLPRAAEREMKRVSAAGARAKRKNPGESALSWRTLRDRLSRALRSQGFDADSVACLLDEMDWTSPKGFSSEEQ